MPSNPISALDACLSMPNRYKQMTTPDTLQKWASTFS